MKVIYTKDMKTESGVVYRSPDLFYGVINKASEVVVEGDYPNIVNAYKDAGIKVNSEAKKAENQISPSKMTLDQLKGELTEQNIEFPDNAKKADLFKLLEEAGGA